MEGAFILKLLSFLCLVVGEHPANMWWFCFFRVEFFVLCFLCCVFCLVFSVLCFCFFPCLVVGEHPANVLWRPHSSRAAPSHSTVSHNFQNSPLNFNLRLRDWRITFLSRIRPSSPSTYSWLHSKWIGVWATSICDGILYYNFIDFLISATAWCLKTFKIPL